jgi:hypothetical protein
MWDHRSIARTARLLIPLCLTGCAYAKEQFRTCDDSYHEPLGLPTFDASQHSDRCSGGVSAAHDLLRRLGLAPDVPLAFERCCVDHDKAYYYGQNPHRELRRQADQALRQCVADVAGPTKDAGANADGERQAQQLATIIYLGVRTFGGPCVNAHVSRMPFRWGYGVDFIGQPPLSSPRATMLRSHGRLPMPLAP